MNNRRSALDTILITTHWYIEKDQSGDLTNQVRSEDLKGKDHIPSHRADHLDFFLPAVFLLDFLGAFFFLPPFLAFFLPHFFLQTFVQVFLGLQAFLHFLGTHLAFA